MRIRGLCAMYDTAVFDLDGILLKDMVMTPGGLSAVQSLLDEGWSVIYSSGKNYWFTVGGLSFSNLMRDDTMVIAENGGVIFYPSTKETVTLSACGDDIATIRDIFANERCTLSKGLLLHKETGAALWREPKETIFTVYPDKFNTIPALGEELRGIIAEQGLKLYVLEHCDAIDVLPQGQNKGAALDYLARKGQLDLKRTVAFGDGSNDVEMLEIVGMPLTVGNAKEMVKETVSSRGGYVAQGVFGEGVLEGVSWLRNRNR